MLEVIRVKETENLKDLDVFLGLKLMIILVCYLYFSDAVRCIYRFIFVRIFERRYNLYFIFVGF